MTAVATQPRSRLAAAFSTPAAGEGGAAELCAIGEYSASVYQVLDSESYADLDSQTE